MTYQENLEIKYLKYKIAYYEGNPLVTDAEFDKLEEILKQMNSKVPGQVGSKRIDFNFKHPHRMLSLSKVQTFKNKDDSTNYMESDFLAWYNKKTFILNKEYSLYSSPKFDGNAINIIYKGENLFLVLTRGNGSYGKDITNRIKKIVDNQLSLSNLNVNKDDTIEIRAEVVIDKNIFYEKYHGDIKDGKYENPRNYVAGVLRKDDYNETKISELTAVPLHFILNGEHISQNHFMNTPFCNINYNKVFTPNEYIKTIKYYESIRDKFKFQLDGVVIALPVETRKILGENEHDPEWSYAVKFIPEDAITTYSGIEWNISKRGELTPVILMEPVKLAGTTVKRASGYNAGYIVNNKIGPNAVFSIAKAGDIIPEIQNIIAESPENIILPDACPACGTPLTYDGIHLMCNNENCNGRISKKLASAALNVGIKGVGNKTLEKFANDFKNLFELMKWVLIKGESKEISKYGIEYNSRSHEIFVDAFKNIKSLPYEKIIMMLGYDNVGKKLSKQLALEHCGLEPNYTGLERALVTKLHTPEVELYIKEAIMALESLGVSIDKYKALDKDTITIGVCATGSPKNFGFKNKKEFISQFSGLYETTLSDPKCKYLITDDYNSTSNKMKIAKKKGINIKTYGDFKI